MFIFQFLQVATSIRTSLVWPDCFFFPFLFVEAEPQIKTEKNCLATRYYITTSTTIASTSRTKYQQYQKYIPPVPAVPAVPAVPPVSELGLE